jgi:hypothetical protein
MAAVDVIYLLAASLWIVVVVAALCIGVRVALKFRARRRRMHRLLGLVRGRASGTRWRLDQVVMGVVADALDVPRRKAVSSRPRARRRR